jgi:hypothetical protein
MKFTEFMWFVFGRLGFYRVISHQKARARWAEIVTGKGVR